MGEGYVSTAFKLLVSPLKVGRHKRTGRGGPVEQDGLISSILILVYLVGLSVSVIISQFLSSERVVTGHQVQPFVTQLFLILLLIPGVATIAYAFKYRGYIRTVIHHPHTMSYPEIINMAGLYIFASCAIAFDLFLCHLYHTSLQKAIETLDSTMKKEGAALQDVQELQKLNDCAEKMQPFQREGSEMLQTIVASHRINVEHKREILFKDFNLTVCT
ncbi:hypothetical protein EB796_007659 [Bugula neritina]|uniref:Uncharacterized protein n=1 Tax=Bugula neritina TaxID=10212 RepID=A0A7J7K5Y4_BUGNE|nr:hypothetical protein EB796_007659 [Bugula neritina]